MNNQYDPTSLEFETELVTPEALEEMNIEMVDAIMSEAQASDNKEDLVEAITDVVEEFTGVDIDGDGFINDELDVEAFGMDAMEMDASSLAPTFTDVQVVDVDNVQNIQVNNIEIGTTNVDNVDMSSIEVVETEAASDDTLAGETFDETPLSGSVEQESFDAAVESQAKADEAIEVGDYEAAQLHRQDAELESEYAGTDSMLHGSDSTELEWADHHQDRALELESTQAENAQAGDYSTARENSLDAASAMQEADQLAGGSDHSGQAQLEATQMDWADWHQQQADTMLDDATGYMADGNVDAAGNSLDAALDQQDQADTYGDLGTHGGDVAVYDPTADIESNDYNSYTGDTTMDTTTDTSYTDTSTDFTV